MTTLLQPVNIPEECGLGDSNMVQGREKHSSEIPAKYYRGRGRRRGFRDGILCPGVSGRGSRAFSTAHLYLPLLELISHAAQLNGYKYAPWTDDSSDRQVTGSS